MNVLPDLDEELKSTRKALERVATDQFSFSPHPKSKSMIWLATHVATLVGWGTTCLTTDELRIDDFKPDPEPKDNAELLERFDKQIAEFRAALANATPEALATEWACYWGGREIMRLPRAAVLRNVVLNHLIHHRGQLTMYFRMAGIPVPGLYGPSADEGDMAPPVESSAAGS
jgi:uncharacterized damage-inducible protein DinB